MLGGGAFLKRPLEYRADEFIDGKSRAFWGKQQQFFHVRWRWIFLVRYRRQNARGSLDLSNIVRHRTDIMKGRLGKENSQKHRAHWVLWGSPLRGSAWASISCGASLSYVRIGMHLKTPRVSEDADSGVRWNRLGASKARRGGSSFT